MKAIGIGCFWFALRPGGPAKAEFDPKTHIENIRHALETVDNVSNITILAPKEIIWSAAPSGEDEDENYFPIFRRVHIDFDIFMPKRIIEKHSLRFPIPNTEHYRVEVVYGRRSPVTYIHYDLEAVPSDLLVAHTPASTVVFIREYLQEKLKEHPTVQFQFLGPSPFHADFFVEATDEKNDNSAKDLSISSRGYRTLLFIVPARDKDGLVPAFINLNNEAFGTFYRTVRYRNRALILKSKITSKVGPFLAEKT